MARAPRQGAAGAPHAVRRPAGRRRRDRLRRPRRAQFRCPNGRTKTSMCSTPRSPISARLRDKGRRVIVAGWTRRLARASVACARRTRPEVAGAGLLAGAGQGGARRRAAAGGHRARARLRDRRSGDHRRAGHSRRPPGAAAQAQAARAGRARRGLVARGGRSRRAYRPRHRPLRRAADDRRRRARRTIAWKSITPAATGCSCRSRTSNFSRATARKTRGAARPAGLVGLADAQGAAEEARARDGGRTDPRRGGAPVARGAAPHPARRALRRILRALPL